MVIQSAPNKDFRRAAIELRAKKQGKTHFLPNQVGQLTSEDGKKRRELTDAEKDFLASGSNVQRIGDKVVHGGISVRQRQEASPRIDDRADTPVGESEPQADLRPQTNGNGMSRHIDEDALALQELLGGESESTDGPKVHIIPQAEEHVTEDDAYAIDVATRPDVPTLDDYARVPIDDFGAALLRGMGGGNAAQKRKRANVEAYVPKSRPDFLGLGAKSREEAFGKEYVKEADKGLNRREAMRFVPLKKTEQSKASPALLPSPSQKGMLEDGPSGSPSRRDRYDGRSSRRDKEDGRDTSRRHAYSDESEEERERRRRRKERERERNKGDDFRRHQESEHDRGRDSDREYARRRSDKYRDRSRSPKDHKRDSRRSERDDRDRRR